MGCGGRLIVQDEIVEAGFRLLVATCSCESGAGEIFGQCDRDDDDPRRELFMSLGMVPSLEVGREHAAGVVEGDGIDTRLELLDVWCAFLGLPLSDLASSGTVCRRQMLALTELKTHHLRCDAEWVWSVRRKTFGDPLTCVARAVDGIGGFYEPDRPLPSGWRMSS